MHILLGLLGALVTILILLNRLANAGIDLGGLTPFLWHRRRKWKKKYQGNPIYQSEEPMEVTALLMAAAAKAEGDISAEQKRLILDLFANEFKLSKKESLSLLVASTHILGDGQDVLANVGKVLAPSKAKFSAEQAGSCVGLIERVSLLDGPLTDSQEQLISALSKTLQVHSEPKGAWEVKRL